MTTILTGEPETCKYCGCTEKKPCVMGGLTCAWFIFHGGSPQFGMPLVEDPFDNICCAPDCVEKAYRAACEAVEREPERYKGLVLA